MYFNSVTSVKLRNLHELEEECQKKGLTRPQLITLLSHLQPNAMEFETTSLELRLFCTVHG